MSLSRLLDAFSAFIDLVAATLAAGLAGLKGGRRVQIAEGEDGAFRLLAPGMEAAPFRLDGPALPAALGAALKGRDVELVLSPERFLFQPLELPKAAADFLAGIVRAQIDRLTPWSAADAAFGWTEPVAGADERIALKVAATARARIAPLADRLKGLGARAVVVATRSDGALVRVMDEAAAGHSHAARIRQGLLAVLGGVAIAASVAVVLGDSLGGSFDAELEALNGRIATQRRALMAARNGTGADGAALRALEQLKRQQAPTVLVLDALSDVLPNDTYLTQLDIEEGKVGLTGISRNASSLIALLEQSRRFSKATFVAPTTRSDSEEGERFQIEARITMSMEAPR